MKTADIAVLLAYLVGIVGFGLWCARKTKTTDAFMSAGRNLPGWAIGLSIFGSYISSISFLANPGATFKGDWNAFAFTLATPIATLVAVRYFVPFYRRIGAVSAYEHLEHRFGNWARTYVVVCYLLTQMARTGTIVYLLGLAVAPLIGWSVETIIVVTAVVMTSYIVLGGIEAAVWTGVVQGIVLMLGPLVCVYFLLTGIDGGAATVIEEAAAQGKLGLGGFGPSLTTNTFWVVFVYGLVINLQNFAIDQGYVQRYATARSVREAKKSVLVGGLLYVPLAALFFFIGTALWVFYAQNPELLAGLDAAKHPDKVFPQFIVYQLPAGLTGLVIAAIFAAAMDSSLNSMATLTLCDLYKRYLRPAAGEKESLRVLHVSTLVWGAAALGVGLWMVHAGHALEVWWTMAGVFGGGMLGLFLLGRVSPRTTSGHALAAVSSGVALILWMTFSPAFPGVFGGVVSPFHPLMIIVFGTLTILCVGLLLTAFSPGARYSPAALPTESTGTS
jgi:SSS family solute:Na+ symporter